MASETPETPIAHVAESVDSPPPAPKKKRTINIHPKVQKTIDSLKAKYDKLVAENKELKVQLKALKSQHSRIRRIPKAEPAEPAQA